MLRLWEQGTGRGRRVYTGVAAGGDILVVGEVEVPGLLTRSAVRELPLRFLGELRRPPVAVRMVLAFALGAVVVGAALPLLAAAGISLGACPIGWESFAARLVAFWVVAAIVVGLPSWLLALDPIPLTVIWAALAALWRFGPQLLQLLPG